MTWYTVVKKGSMKDGDLFKAKVEGKEVLVMRIKDNFYATSCYCTHENYDLSEGFIDDGNLICPNHFATFKPSTGEVVSPPEGADDIPPLSSYETRVQGDDIQVNLK